MATLPIDYFLGYPGSVPWNTIVMDWDGIGTTWTVRDLSDDSVVYTGALKQAVVTVAPSSRYDFRLTTTVATVDYTLDIMVYTTVLPAPVSLAVGAITDDSASLTWAEVPSADSYDVCDVTDSYALVDNVAVPSLDLTGLDASTRHSYSVRTRYGGEASRWSSPVTFFTLPSPTVTPGVYLFRPETVYVWAAGRPGSSDPTWLPNSSDWFHGDGLEWGDVAGQQTTYFFYGLSAPFGQIAGASVTKVEVWLQRAASSGDPGLVLSRWGLHSYLEKPEGEPMPGGASGDFGQMTRGQGDWVELPNAWADSLIAGTSRGIYWGRTPFRFQMSPHYELEQSPRIGDIRVTVG